MAKKKRNPKKGWEEKQQKKAGLIREAHSRRGGGGGLNVQARTSEQEKNRNSSICTLKCFHHYIEKGVDISVPVPVGSKIIFKTHQRNTSKYIPGIHGLRSWATPIEMTIVWQKRRKYRTPPLPLPPSSLGQFYVGHLRRRCYPPPPRSSSLKLSFDETMRKKNETVKSPLHPPTHILL